MNFYFIVAVLFLISGCLASQLQKVEVIVNHLKLHHVTVLLNRTHTVEKQIDILLQTITTNVPTTIIEIQNIELHHEFKTPMLKSFRLSKMYIIIPYDHSGECNPKQINSILENFSIVLSISPRPKCLIILFQYDCSVNEKKKILQNAWFLKFLDLTILEIYQDASKITLANWNPFTNAYETDSLKDANELFPDKLLNVYKYPLRIFITHLPPFITVEESNNKSITVSGSTFEYVSTIADKLNFKLNFDLNLNNESTQQIFETSMTKLQKNEINLTPIGYFIDRLSEKNIVPGYPFWESKVVIVVPIIETWRVLISRDLLIYFFSILVTVLIILIFARFFKFDPKQWTIINLLQILLGMPISQPTKNVERIFFYSIVISWLFLTTILFSKLTSIESTVHAKEFNTLEDIFHSKIPRYTVYYPSSDDPVEIQQLILKSEKIMNHVDCIKILLKTNNAICILPKRSAEYFTNKYVNKKGIPIMKIAPINFRNQFYTIPYERSSPFAEKFNKICLYIIESHILTESRIQKSLRLDEPRKASFTTDILLNGSFFMLVTGYLLATVVFTYETVRINDIKKLLKK